MIDLTGQKFGRLFVQEFAGRDKRSNSYWNCLCACGNTARVRGGDLKTGNTQSCGCVHKDRVIEAHTTNGQAKRGLKTLVYKVWIDMIQRCHNKSSAAYKYYGGRGIKVCERWRVCW